MKIQDRALLVRLCIEGWGTRKKDEDANKAVSDAKNSQEDATTVSKLLIPKDALKEVKAKAELARKHVRSVSQAWSDDGARMLDAAQLIPLQDRLRRDFRPAWWDEVQKVVGQLNYYRNEWGPAHLGDLYSADAYPSREEMEEKFKWGLDVLPLNPDAKELRSILGSEFVDEIQRNAETRMIEQLYLRIAEPIRNMVKRLMDPESTFKDSLVTNVEDIAALIPALNLTGDPRLAALQQQINDDLVQYTGKNLRLNPTARQVTATKAQAILDKLKDYLPQAAESQSRVPVPEVEVESDAFAAMWDGIEKSHPTGVYTADAEIAAENAAEAEVAMIEGEGYGGLPLLADVLAQYAKAHPIEEMVEVEVPVAVEPLSWRDRIRARTLAKAA